MTTALAARLHAAGLPPAIPVIPHRNRRVLVSRTAAGALRVHQGYQHAPQAVLVAIARWARPRLQRTDRLAAQRILLGFPVHDFVPARPATRRPAEAPPEEAGILTRLRALHREFNEGHFEGVLGEVTLTLSRRMRRRLGEFRPASAAGELPEIVIARRHFRRDGWAGARVTLLHEMVHQWQAETGRRLGHGSEFRRKCAEIGIETRAVARPGTDARYVPAQGMTLVPDEPRKNRR